MPPTVDFTDGYGLGVSAMYATQAAGMLMVAGGANFPDEPAAEGGRKAFYDGIYLYDGASWHRAGTMPVPAAYGTACSFGDWALFAGGTGPDGALKTVWLVAPDSAGCVHVEPAAELSLPVEQAASAVSDGCMYLFGGIAGGDPSNRLFVIDLSSDEPRCRELKPAPEAMVQPVMASSNGMLYVWGGFNPATGQTSSNGYIYNIATGGWLVNILPPVPDGGTFTGACAATLADGRIAVAGGVDRDIFTAALALPADSVRNYLLQPAEAYRFRRTVWIFDPATSEWTSAGESIHTARAGASLVPYGGGICLLGGELKPGIRTPENYYTTDLQ